MEERINNVCFLGTKGIIHSSICRLQDRFSKLMELFAQNLIDSRIKIESIQVYLGCQPKSKTFEHLNFLVNEIILSQSEIKDVFHLIVKLRHYIRFLDQSIKDLN